MVCGDNLMALNFFTDMRGQKGRYACQIVDFHSFAVSHRNNPGTTSAAISSLARPSLLMEMSLFA